MRKVFVNVIVKFNVCGQIIPLSVEWEDGTKYEIKEILDVRRAASLKVGGQGTRYLCKIENRETYLFYENPNWFVESKI